MDSVDFLELETLIEKLELVTAGASLFETYLDTSQSTGFTDKNEIHEWEISLSCQLVNPFIEIVDEPPPEPCVVLPPAKRSGPTPLQVEQAIELYHYFIDSGMKHAEAVALLGPLSSVVDKYSHSFSISEIKWNIPQLVGENFLYDQAFMSPLKK